MWKSVLTKAICGKAPRRHFSGSRLCEIAPLLDKYDCFIFDCDGVLWHGMTVLNGVPKFLDTLRNHNKRVAFMTNNATKTRQMLLGHFLKLGLHAEMSEVYGSAFAAGLYLKRRNFDRKALVVGMEGLVQELTDCGIRAERPVTGENSVLGVGKIELDPEVGAVVAGLDVNMSYWTLANAALHLRYSPDCIFLATNKDAAYNGTDGRLYPAGGTMVSALEYTSGRTATIAGKPSTLMLDEIIDSRGVSRERTLMVGDRLDTDIEFGLAGDVHTLLVMTGVTDEKLLAESTTRPHYVVGSFADLL